MNARLAGVTARAGVAGFTVSVTATVFGDPRPRGRDRDRAGVGARRQPARSLADTDTVPGAVPLAGLTRSQGWSSAP